MFGKTIILAIAVFVLVSLSPANAQVEEIVLKVDGMACPMCAYGLEVMLKNMEGSASVKILYEEGEAVLVWIEGKPFDASAIWNAVDDAGFTLRSIKGTFVGTIEKDGDMRSLVFPSPLNQHFFLYEPSFFKDMGNLYLMRDGKSRLLSQSMRKTLDGYEQETGRVRIVGQVHFKSIEKGIIQLFLGVDSIEEAAERKEGKPSPASP